MKLKSNQPKAYVTKFNYLKLTPSSATPKLTKIAPLNFRKTCMPLVPNLTLDGK